MARTHRRGFVIGLAAVWLGANLVCAGVAAAEVPMKAIAIVPFNLPSEPAEWQWLGEGLPRVLALRLGALSQVKVTVLTSPPSVAGERSRHPLEGGEVGPFLAGLRAQGYHIVVLGKFHQLETVLRAEVHVWLAEPERQLGKTLEQSPAKDPDALGIKIATFLSSALQVGSSESEGRRVRERYTQSPEAFERFAKALTASEMVRGDGDIDQAAALFREAFALDGRFAVALHQLANLYFRHGQYANAAETYQAYLNQGRRSAAVYRLLGHAYFAQRDIPRAVEAYRRGLQLDASDAQLHVDLGLAYASQQDYENATKAFLRALEVRPDEPLAFANLGVVYLLQGNFPAATSSLRRAQMLQGSNATLAYNLGLSLMFEGAYDAARQQFELALQLQPGLAAAAYQLALLVEHAEPKQAIDYWRRYVELAAGRAAEESWLAYAQERLQRLQQP